jgi:hypothetical protein
MTPLTSVHIGLGCVELAVLELRTGCRYWCSAHGFDMHRPEGDYRTSGSGDTYPF